MELSGSLKLIRDTQVISDSFRKREFVIKTDEQYPQEIQIEFNGDKCSILDNYQAGEMVKVSINIQGRMWTSPQGEEKYFNTIKAWRIEKEGAATGSQQNQQPTAQQPVQAKQQAASAGNGIDSDEVPF